MKIFTVTNEKLISTALLVLRIALAAIFFAHGAQKVLGVFGGKGLEATVSGMSGKFGPVLPYFTAFVEFLGGIAMLLGILTRFFGIALLINMLVAVFAVHLQNGFFAPTGFEFPFSLAMTSLAITLAGPGLYSLDYILFNPRQRSQTTFAVPGGSATFRPVS